MDIVYQRDLEELAEIAEIELELVFSDEEKHYELWCVVIKDGIQSKKYAIYSQRNLIKNYTDLNRAIAWGEGLGFSKVRMVKNY